jgi:hypothetical protein
MTVRAENAIEIIDTHAGVIERRRRACVEKLDASGIA